MKRFIALLLSVLMLLSLCACGGSESDNESYDDDEYYDDGEESEREEAEEREPGVPEGQVKADLETMSKDDNKLKYAVQYGEVDSIEIEHSYDEDAHIDTCVAHIYFSCWYGVLEYSKPCTYQYSKDSDLWSLIGSDEGAIGEIEYDIDALKSLEGYVFDVNYSNLAIPHAIYGEDCASGVTIEKATVEDGQVKLTLNFDFEAPEGLGHVSQRVTLPCQNRYALEADYVFDRYGYYLCIASKVTKGDEHFGVYADLTDRGKGIICEGVSYQVTDD